MAVYKAVKFITGQEIVAEVVEEFDDGSVTLKRMVYVLPHPTNANEMKLSPFIGFSDIETEVTFEKSKILALTPAFDALTDMMDKNFNKSAIIQPNKSSVSKLIL